MTLLSNHFYPGFYLWIFFCANYCLIVTINFSRCCGWLLFAPSQSSYFLLWASRRLYCHNNSYDNNKTKESRIWKEKVADSKISGYVWTGPKLSSDATTRKLCSDFDWLIVKTLRHAIMRTFSGTVIWTFSGTVIWCSADRLEFKMLTISKQTHNTFFGRSWDGDATDIKLIQSNWFDIYLQLVLTLLCSVLLKQLVVKCDYRLQLVQTLPSV